MEEKKFKSNNSKTTIGIAISPCNLGALQEYRAIIWLVGQGYEVYRNVLPNGQVDFVVKKDGLFTEIDVKTLQTGSRGPKFSWDSYLSPEQITRGVRLLFVSETAVGWNRDYF